MCLKRPPQVLKQLKMFKTPPTPPPPPPPPSIPAAVQHPAAFSISHLQV
jgi:hypothetical protein